MKSHQGLVGLFVACLVATLFVALFFNAGGGLPTHTPSLSRTPLALRSHNDAAYVKLTKEVFNTPTLKMAAPTSAPTNDSPNNAPSNEDFGDIPEQDLQLWQQVVQDPSKRQEVYDGYLATAKQLRLVGTASQDLLGAHLTIVSAFISRFSQIGPNHERLSFEKFCDQLGMGVEAARSLMIAGTNVDELKKKYGENPDKTMTEIANNFVALSKANIFQSVLTNENATRTLNINMKAMKMKRHEPTKSAVDISAYPSIPAETKKNLLALQDEKKRKFNNPRVREVMGVVDTAMRKKNAILNTSRAKVVYHKTKRKTEKERKLESFEAIGNLIEQEAPLLFERLVTGEFEDEKLSEFVAFCQHLTSHGEKPDIDSSESVEFDAEVPSVAPPLEPITPANAVPEEKAEVPPPTIPDTSAPNEVPVMPPNGTDLNGGTAPPVEMDIVDRDDFGVMTGVTSALSGLMTSVFGTSDREDGILTASSLDEGKRDYPAKNQAVGTRASFGAHNLIVKARSDGVHYWRRV